MKQVILGSGGSVGSELALALKEYTSEIRLVSRNPQKINPGDELFPANLLNSDEVSKAVEGASVVYLTAGLEYKTAVWKQQWPPIMRNVIDACMKHKARLVFFDNMYLYDKDHIRHMTEETPVNPCSEKGRVRAMICGMIMEEVNKGRLSALIARAADFISLKNSAIVETVYKNFIKGKKANLIGSADALHNFTFAPDAAKATALLGNTDDAYGQVWHLPSCKPALTGRQWVELVAREMNVEPKFSVLPVFMMGVLGLFIPIMKELKEMSYQNTSDYFFDSSKFEKRFGITATPAPEAIRWVIANMKPQS